MALREPEPVEALRDTLRRWDRERGLPPELFRKLAALGGAGTGRCSKS